MAKAFCTDAKIDKIEIKKGTKVIKIKEIKLTASQVENVTDIIEDGGEIKITIEGKQGHLEDEKPKKVGFSSSRKPKKDGKKLAANDKTDE